MQAVGLNKQILNIDALIPYLRRTDSFTHGDEVLELSEGESCTHAVTQAPALFIAGHTVAWRRRGIQGAGYIIL